MTRRSGDIPEWLFFWFLLDLKREERLGEGGVVDPGRGPYGRPESRSSSEKVLGLDSGLGLRPGRTRGLQPYHQRRGSVEVLRSGPSPTLLLLVAWNSLYGSDRRRRVLVVSSFSSKSSQDLLLRGFHPSPDNPPESGVCRRRRDTYRFGTCERKSRKTTT